MKVVLVSSIFAAGLLCGQPVMEEKRIEIRRSGPGPGAEADMLLWRGAVPGAPLGAQTFEFVAAEGVPGRVVKGAPYSADTTSETIQTLADGNRIVQKNTASFARDSEGRTRREIHVEVAGKPEEAHKVVMIDDPVAGVHYVLNSRTKTATKLPLPKEGGLRGPAWSSGSAPPPPPMIGGITTSGAAVRVMRGDLPAPVVEELGKQTMEGVEVTGKRTTITLPAGSMGNERPLVTKSETWYSDALKTTVLVKRFDPRMGETTSRTTNIRQGEQPSYLFEVPADYKLEEGRPRTFQIERKQDEL
jgi:hypothetical protein